MNRLLLIFVTFVSCGQQHVRLMDKIDPDIVGPAPEDKHFTPIRQVVVYPEGPDTYGVVVVANQIRTILEFNQK